MTANEDRALQAELDELERTDPDVWAAAEYYDRMVEKIMGRPMPDTSPTPVDLDVLQSMADQANNSHAWDVRAASAAECARQMPRVLAEIRRLRAAIGKVTVDREDLKIVLEGIYARPDVSGRYYPVADRLRAALSEPPEETR